MALPVKTGINQPARKDEPQQAPSVPGTGIAGKVICPFLSIAGRDVICAKSGCEMWVELQISTNGQYVGRCALAWNTILLTEVRRELELLRTSQEKNKK